MLRIALMVYDISLTGGAERVAINLANEFAKENTVYIISTFMEKAKPTIINKEVKCVLVSDVSEKIPLKFRQLKNKIHNILIEEQIDILMAITAGIVTLAIQGAKGTGSKVIYCEHSNLENRTYGKKHLLRQYYGAKKSDAIVTLTERDRNNFISMFGVNKKRVCVIPNWYDYNNNDKKYDLKSKKIISVGRLEEVKGYNYIVDAAEVILANNPDWEWHIYGDGSLHDTLQEQINERKISKLILQGNVNNMEQQYSQYAFVVMTSLYEGLPLSLLEAQASNLPIVCFDCPTGPAEIVINNVNGYVVPQFDMVGLIKSIQDLISSDEKRKEFSNHSKDKMQYYSKDSVKKLWEELFMKIKNGGIFYE